MAGKYYISTQEECEELLIKLNNYFNIPNEHTITYSSIENIKDSSNKTLEILSQHIYLLSESELSKISNTQPEIDLDF
jgi:hypothetical protein